MADSKENFTDEILGVKGLRWTSMQYRDKKNGKAYLEHNMENSSGVKKTNVVHQEGNCSFQFLGVNILW